MTYRVGAHSTSDDDSKYREPSAPEEGWDDERSYWEARSPIVRFGRYLHQRGCFSGADEERMRRALRKEAIAALSAAEEAVAAPPLHGRVGRGAAGAAAATCRAAGAHGEAPGGVRQVPEFSRPVSVPVLSRSLGLLYLEPYRAVMVKL